VTLLAKLKQHWSLLVVTHDAGDLLEVADRCWTLDCGILEAADLESLGGKRRSVASI
jgi:energy-coupling factor transport system ATP-binding protein